jgi:hypothetical protein
MSSANGLANGSTTPTQRTAIPSPRVVRISLPSEHKSFWEYWGYNDSHLVALSAFLLGVVFSWTIAAALYFKSTPQCWLYMTFLCLFHFLEYFITAKYKPDTVTLDGTISYTALLMLSFLVQQWVSIFHCADFWSSRIRTGVVFLSPH